MALAPVDGLPTVVGQIRGAVQRHPDVSDELYVDNLGVAPERRREGIGRRLLDELLAWGRERGCATAWVLTEPENAPARAIYAAHGFEALTVACFARALWPEPTP